MKYLSIVIPCVFLSSIFAQSPRIIPHIPPPRTLFDTWILISNPDQNETGWIDLTGFEVNGSVLEVVHMELEPNKSLRLKSTTVFEALNLSHIRVEGTLYCTVEIRSPFSDNMDLFVGENQWLGTRFQIHLPQTEDEFIGLAIVNINDDPVELQGLLLLENGSSRTLIQSSLNPWGKELHIVSDPFGNGTEYTPGDRLEIRSSAPVSILILRGGAPIRNDSTLIELIPTVLSPLAQ